MIKQRQTCVCPCDGFGLVFVTQNILMCFIVNGVYMCILARPGKRAGREIVYTFGGKTMAVSQVLTGGARAEAMISAVLFG